MDFDVLCDVEKRLVALLDVASKLMELMARVDASAKSDIQQHLEEFLTSVETIQGDLKGQFVHVTAALPYEMNSHVERMQLDTSTTAVELAVERVYALMRTVAEAKASTAVTTPPE